MLSKEEQKKLKQLLQLLENQKHTSQIKVTDRSRDEKGRFLPNKELELVDKEELKLRSIKVVHVKGTYGTYLIKNKWLSETGRNVLISIALIVALTVLF